MRQGIVSGSIITRRIEHLFLSKLNPSSSLFLFISSFEYDIFVPFGNLTADRRAPPRGSMTSPSDKEGGTFNGTQEGAIWMGQKPTGIQWKQGRKKWLQIKNQEQSLPQALTFCLNLSTIMDCLFLS
ncbi:MAG: hypothetical protein HY282_12930 [Nitrospirae bacterium]|nr:hypothetical protein [Candidatus Manganitrophaceae bacterium]